jgi:hypothetical protein
MPNTGTGQGYGDGQPDGRGHDRVKAARLADRLRQAPAPVELRAGHVCGARDQHGQRDHGRNEKPRGERVPGERTGQRAQRLGGVLSRRHRLMVAAERGG